MATLTGKKIKNTYDALLKLSDNDNLTTTAKQVTDGFGNNAPLWISTTQIGIGVTPEVGYDLHVYSNAKVGGNLTITGDLTVNGTTTTVDTDTLRVEDPLIELARLNTSADSVDIGFYGKYHPSATTLYSGLFRDAGDDKYKLFKDLQEEPTTTVNTSGTGYTVATLVANFEGTLTGTIASSTVATTQSAGDNSTKVATTAYVDTTAGNYLPLAGGTMSGNIAMGSNNISGGGTFTATTFSGQLSGTISSSTTATTQTQGDNSTKVATTAYVDSAIGGQDTLAEILANGNTTGGTDISVSSGDDITLAAGSKVQYSTNSFMTPENNVTGAEISTAGDFRVKTGTTPSLALILGGTQNATFYGNIDINGNNKHIRFIDTYGNWMIEVGDGANNFKIHSQSLNADYLTIDGSGNTTIAGNLTVSGTGQSSFAGQVTVPATPSASTDAASKGYVDSQVGANNELSEVLSNGNTTGGTDISVSTGDDITFADSSKSIYGAGSDLQVYHDGSNSHIKNYTGHLYIENFADDKDIKFLSDNGTGGTEIYFELQGISGGTNPFTVFPDNSFAVFGNGHDLQIYHDGSNSYINETGTGVLSIQSDGTEVQINKGASEYMGRFITDAGVKLYYDNSLKFETTNEGIKINGHISLDTNDNSRISGDSDSIDFNLWDNNSAYQTRMTILDTGNVGIGTTSPNKKLEILYYLI